MGKNAYSGLSDVQNKTDEAWNDKISEIENNTEGAVKALNEIEKASDDAAAEIAKVFRELSDSIDELSTSLDGLTEPIETVADRLERITMFDFSDIPYYISEIEESISSICDNIGKTSLEDWLSLGMQVISTGVDVFSLGDQKNARKPAAPQSVSTTVNFASNADVLTAGLSELIDLWDSEAAAKALSTAATTAWNAVCSVGTTIAGAFGAAINFLTSPIGVVVMAITALIAIIVLLVANWDTVKAALITGWETVKALLGTAAEWFNTAVIQPIVGFLTALWTRITTFVSGLMVLLMPYIQQFMLLVQTAVLNIQTFFSGLGEYLTGVFSVNWAEQFGAFGEVLNVFFTTVQEIWTAVQTIFEGIIQFVTGVFSGDWESAWNGIVQIFTGIWEGLEAAIKTPVNGVIGLINGLVQAVVSGINGAIDALNTLRFTVPDWVPEIGGKYFGFNIGKISAPQIPYLAQGAVLPANRPFLAVVGDQKHGTNVEAPLETIQQALADVLAQQGAQDIRITFTGDLAQLARVLKPQLDRENRRVGGSLARGVTV